jgi:hypothetical protein
MRAFTGCRTQAAFFGLMGMVGLFACTAADGTQEGLGGAATAPSGGAVGHPTGGTTSKGIGGLAGKATGASTAVGNGGSVALGSGGGSTTVGNGGTIGLGSGGGSTTVGTGGMSAQPNGGNTTVGAAGTVVQPSGGNTAVGTGGTSAQPGGGSTAMGTGGNIPQGGSTSLAGGGTVANGGNTTVHAGGTAGSQTTGSGGVGSPPALSFDCVSDNDCCVVLDSCRVSLWLVTQAQKGELESYLGSLPHGTCTPCVAPDVQVSCVNGQCQGEKQGSMHYPPTGLAATHCGRIDVSSAGAAGSAGAMASPYRTGTVSFSMTLGDAGSAGTESSGAGSGGTGGTAGANGGTTSKPVTHFGC